MVIVPATRACGFTLIELMITLAVVGMLAAVAVPSTKEMIARQRVKSAAGDVANTLMRARSFSVKLQRNVSVTPVSAAAWQSGWSVPNPDGGDFLFDARNAIAQVVISGPATVTYQSNGRAVSASEVKFEVSGSGTELKRCVVLELTGMPYHKKGACSP